MKVNGVISIFLTLMVIGALLIAGPAHAVEITLSTPQVDGDDVEGDVTIGDTVEFDATVDLSAGENIPVQNVSLLVGDLECVFELDGTLLSDDVLCSAFTLSLSTDNSEYVNATRYGYGFGLDENDTEVTVNTSFSTGYGYGEASTPMLIYTVEWDTTDFDEDEYDITFYATARSGASYFKYASEDTTSITLAERNSGSSGNDRPSTPAVKTESVSFVFTGLSPGLKDIDINAKTIPVFGLILNILEGSTNADVKFSDVITPKEAFKGAVYKYFEINVNNVELSYARIKFKVDKSWLSGQSGEVLLERYHAGLWAPLQTKKLNEDAQYVYFEALTPGFSQFAITTKPKEVAPAPIVEPIVTPVAPEENLVIAPSVGVEEQPSSETISQGSGGKKWIWLLVTVVVIAILAVLWNIQGNKQN